MQVEGAQFAEAISEVLEARMRLTGGLKYLEQFKALFVGKTLEKGTQVCPDDLLILSKMIFPSTYKRKKPPGGAQLNPLA